MYNEYEDYMRSVLGYPNNNNYYDTYSTEYANDYFPYRAKNSNQFDESKYEDKYPEIYKILKPMIKKSCNSRFIENISNNDLDSMTNEIYNNVEQSMDIVNVDITTGSNTVRNGNMKVSESKKEETRSCCGNPSLRDLIKILLIKELIDNTHHHMPGPLPRPPRPPMPRPRPPYRNDFNDFDSDTNQYNF